MDDCIFCKIVKGEIPGYKVFENEDYVAFLDIFPFTPGHTLVVPKTHVAIPWDASKPGEYFEVVTKIANHYIKDLGYKYVDCQILGRDVAHAHIHLLPHNGELSNYSSALELYLGKLDAEKSMLAPEAAKQLLIQFQIHE